MATKVKLIKNNNISIFEQSINEFSKAHRGYIHEIQYQAVNTNHGETSSGVCYTALIVYEDPAH